MIKTIPRAWTEEEDSVLRSMYLTHERSEIATALGRTKPSVRKRCSVLGLNHKHPAVTEQERERIRQWYQDRTSTDLEDFCLDDLAKELGRTKYFVSRLAGQMGLTRYSRPVGQAIRSKMSENTKRMIAENGHPKGMLGKKQSDEFKAKMSERVIEWFAGLSQEEKGAIVEKQMATRIEKYGTGNPGWLTASNPYSRTRSGKRADLDNRFFRSAWEANYARYLNWLMAQGQIASWEFECHTFVFHGITRGVISYTPDFKVYDNDGAYEWHEVKGWMDDKSKARLKRMAKYYPDEKIVLIDRKAYGAIAKWRAVIPGWEDTGT